MAEMAARFRSWIKLWLVILSLNGILESVNGLLQRPLSSPFSTAARRNSKSISAQTGSKNFGEDSRYDANNAKQNPLDKSLWIQDETENISQSRYIQRNDPVFSRDTVQTKNLLDRRSIASVAIRRSLAIFLGGSTTSTILSRNFVVQASSAALPTPIDEKRGEALLVGGDDTVELTLEFIPTLDAYVVRYFLFDEPFAAIVDTGSPFLTVPCYCKPYRNRKMFWGCYKPELTRDSGYGNTIEGFDNNYGT